ncbi:MAG: biotin--[acetyl-CoA-carboxylase] ligase [Pseudomonadota bacterium]|nr:biotin--[acetyl-CoA-carboxylase] ligase [Pseudomonadota bacterium]
MHHQLLNTLAEGHCYTAEQLGQQFILTPALLEQTIDQLRAFGVTIHLTPYGYQLAKPIELFDKPRIIHQLSPFICQQLMQLTVFAVIDSTNQYLLNQAILPGNSVCLAEFQTQGRGRHGRHWFSPYASGICLSIKQHYPQLDWPLSGLNIALTVSIVRLLRDLGVQEVGIKWPNDILWHGHKLGGLLLETRNHTHGYEVVAGIGLNIKMPNEGATPIDKPWIALETILQKSISRNTLAALIIEHGIDTLMNYPQSGMAAFKADWQQFDLIYGQTITLQRRAHASGTLEPHIKGIACGIDEQGALVLQVGSQHYCYLDGEVSIVH